LEGLKSFISKYSFDISKDFEIIPYDILLDALDRKSSNEFIEYCIGLYKDLDYFYDATFTPIYLAVKNNNFEIANKLLERGVDINILNPNKGNILSFLSNKYINEKNLKYLIDNNININYNLYCNNEKSLLSFHHDNNYNYNLEFSKFFQSNQTNGLYSNNANITITYFDYIVYHSFISKESIYFYESNIFNLLKIIIQYKNFDINKIHKNSLELIVRRKENKIIEDIVLYKIDFISYEFCDIIIKYSFIYNNTECLICILDVIREKVKIDYIQNSESKIKIDSMINEIIDYAIKNNQLVLIGKIPIIDSYYNNIIDDIYCNINLYKKTGYYPLHEACLNYNYKLIDALIKHNYNVNTKCKKSNDTALMTSIKNKKWDMAHLLLNSSLSLDVNIINSKQENPLIYMINHYHIFNVNIFQDLIKHGADLSLRYKGVPPLILAIKNKRIEYIRIILQIPSININQLYYRKTILDIILEHGIDDEKIFNTLLKKKAIIKYRYLNTYSSHLNNCNCGTLLKKKAIIKYRYLNTYSSHLNNCNCGLIKSLIKNEFNYENYNGKIIHVKSPVNFFIKHSKDRIVERLLDNGASVEETDEDGVTPLIQTIKTGNIRLFKLLLNKYHPDINRKNALGKTALDIAKQLNKKDEFIFLIKIYKLLKELTPKNYIVKDILKDIINVNEYDVNKLYNEKTIMYIFIEISIDDFDIYDSLLKKGAYIDSNYFNFSNFLSLIENNEGLIKAIVKNGIRIRKDDKPVYIKAPVVYFIKHFKNTNNIVEKLLDHGASIDETDKDGVTPLIQTIKSGNIELFKLLLNKYHPDINRKNALGQTPLIIAQHLDKKNEKRNEFISLIEAHIKMNNIKRITNNFNYNINNLIEDIEDIIEEESIININDYNIKSLKEDIKKEELITNIIDYDINNSVNEMEIYKDGLTSVYYSLKNGKYKFLNSLINEQKNCDLLKKILRENKYIDIGKRYSELTIMKILINHHVDDEEIFNILFKRGGYLDYDYISPSLYSNKYSSLIENNTGLLKSIIHNGLIYMNVNDKNNQIVQINTPLIYFIKIGKIQIVEKLLENGASIEETDEEGMTPIFYSIKYFRKDLFILLLNKYRPDITKKNKMGQTPLIFAQHLVIMKKVDLNFYIKELESYSKSNDLIKNINKKNNEVLLLNSLKQKNYDTLKKILIENNDIDINKIYNGNTIINTLINNIVNDEEIYNLLFKKGGYLNCNYVSSNSNTFSSLIEKNSGLLKSIIHNGLIYMNANKTQVIKVNTPIIYFIKSGKIKIAEKLLENGASVEETDEEGMTPIFYSIKCIRKNLFNILLNKYHADITKKNKFGQTPLKFVQSLIKRKNEHFYYFNFCIKELKMHSKTLKNNASIIKNDNKIDNENLLLNSLKQKNYDTLKKILIENNDIDINKIYNGNTIVNTLINNNVKDEELYNLLFKKGGYLNCNYVSSNSNTFSSLIENNSGLLKSIIHNGLIYINKNKTQVIKVNTPLIHFIKIGNIKIAEKLLENGASVEETDEEGLTPIFYSISNNEENLFNILLNKYHADINKTNKIGQTLLIYAINKEKVEYIKILIQHSSVNVNQIYDGKLLIDILLEKGINDEEIFNYMFEKGAYLSSKYYLDKKYYNLIITNLGIIKSIVKNGFIVRRENDEVNQIVKQPIVFFIRYCRKELVKLLLEHGGSINEMDDEGTTPILQTIRCNNFKLFKLFLEKYHPDTFIKNKSGQTPLDYALQLKKNGNCRSEIQKKIISKLKSYNKNLSSSSSISSSDISNISTIININDNNSDISNISTTININNSNSDISNISTININNNNNNNNTPLPPITINKELKKMKEKLLIQDEPLYHEEIDEHKEDINYYLDNGVMTNSSHNEDESSLILKDGEWDENEKKTIHLF